MTQPVGSAVGKPEAVGGVNLSDMTVTSYTAPTIANIPSPFYVVPPLQPRRLGSAGLRSTEFWLCAATAALGAILCFLWPLPSALAGAGLVGLAACSYAWSRGKAKARTVVQGKL